MASRPSPASKRAYKASRADAVIGTAFFIMEWVRGRVVADPLLPGMSPADRGRVYDSMNDVLARLQGRLEGWRLSTVLLAAFILFSVVR